MPRREKRAGAPVSLGPLGTYLDGYGMVALSTAAGQHDKHGMDEQRALALACASIGGSWILSVAPSLSTTHPQGWWLSGCYPLVGAFFVLVSVPGKYVSRLYPGHLLRPFFFFNPSASSCACTLGSRYPECTPCWRASRPGKARA